MNSILILITAIIFFFIGRLSVLPNEEIIKTAKKTIRKLKAKEIPTIITYPTREERDYEGSEEEEIDKKREEAMERAGLL